MPAKPKPEVERKCEAVADLLKLAANPTRARLLWHLGGGPMGHEQAYAEFPDYTPAGVRSQIAFLRDGGVVEDRREGKRLVFSLTDRGRLLLGAIRAIGGAG